MYAFYDIAVRLAGLFLRIPALFNKKLALFISGRKETFSKLSEAISDKDQVFWFHCASLGEFEQGRPLIEELRKTYPGHKFVLSFFSPSGYEVQKNYTHSDVVVYLPLDTRSNARIFLDLIHPEKVFFIKYEFWPNMLRELKNRSIETLLISGIFRKEQIFFTLYGGWMRQSLQSFTHFFVQDDNSEKLLKNIGFNNVTVIGDTRFDRVYKIASQDNHLTFVEDFKKDAYLLVAGSTWPKDEALLLDYINNHLHEKEKVIIAPHEIDSECIRTFIKKSNKKTAVYSAGNINAKDQILIVDTVGLLTRIYSYADTAYVGGGFGKEGIHNILEPATFGIPVVIGPEYAKFREAVELVERNGALVVRDGPVFNQTLEKLFSNTDFRRKTGRICKNFIEEKQGAVKLILEYVHKKP